MNTCGECQYYLDPKAERSECYRYPPAFHGTVIVKAGRKACGEFLFGKPQKVIGVPGMTVEEFKKEMAIEQFKKETGFTVAPIENVIEDPVVPTEKEVKIVKKRIKKKNAPNRKR
jgi:hypothetical protein